MDETNRRPVNDRTGKDRKIPMRAEPSDRHGNDGWIHAEMLDDPSLRGVTFEKSPAD